MTVGKERLLYSWDTSVTLHVIVRAFEHGSDIPATAPAVDPDAVSAPITRTAAISLPRRNTGDTHHLVNSDVVHLRTQPAPLSVASVEKNRKSRSCRNTTEVTTQSLPVSCVIYVLLS